MRARQQFDGVLPERPQGVHEYRAALLSVFLNADSLGALSAALPPDMQPLSLSAALDLIEKLPDEHSAPARDIAGFRLATAVLIEQKQELEPSFMRLLDLSSQEFKRRLRQTLPSPVPEDAKWLTRDLLRQVFYGGNAGALKDVLGKRKISRPQRAITAIPGPTPQPAAEGPLGLETCFDEEAEPPQPLSPESSLNLVSLVTTVDIPSKSLCGFKTLSHVLDPRSWSLSPFWPESFRVELSPDRSGFTKSTAGVPQIGESWSGFLFEHVEWNWNPETVAAFKNFLGIRYQVDLASQQLRLDFALYSCEGSQFFAVELPGGINVDCGFQCVAPLPNPGPQDVLFRLRTVKNIRYADLLDRQAPGQGPAGAGQILSYLAPAIVGLWMNELLRRLYCEP